jgi:hypothetical protein
MVNIITYNLQGPWWSLVYGNWIDNYICISCEFESRWCEVQSIQQYVINFRSDLRQISGFHRVHQFPPPIKLTATI